MRLPLLLPLLLCLAAAWVQPLYGQVDLDRKTAAGSRSKVVLVAPEADLINGIDDVDTEGNCMDEIKRYCSDSTPGQGQLSDCLSDRITEAELAPGADAAVISAACREAVYQYKITRSSNINLNVPLAKACKVDAEQRCNVTWFFGWQSGQVISCLREAREDVAPACKRELWKVQQDAAEDFRADPQLYAACQSDAEALCKDVEKGGGRVGECLRDKRQQLGWECEEQLFRQDAENADDIRLSVRLFSKCLPDKREFCTDIEPGGARVKECLEGHRHELGDDCKAEVDKMIEARTRDFRLDSRLVRYCSGDILETCAVSGNASTWAKSSGHHVTTCLQDFYHELKDPKCREQVKKYLELAAEDVRFDLPLADACYQDRRKLCPNVPAGSASVIRCMLKYRTKLSPTCGAVMFDEEVRFSANIDFQVPMRDACVEEVETYCKDVPKGEARVIRCLQDAKYEKDFGKACRERVQEYEGEAAGDYRLNYRLAQACKSEVPRLCDGMCKAPEDGGSTLCGGTVLRCLTGRKEEIQDEACQAEVSYYAKMEVSDFRNDVILAAACREDVEKLCANVEPGEGRVHECLRASRDVLSAACRREELLLEEEEADSIQLRPGLLRKCRSEVRVFCKDVSPGDARLFRCLAERSGDADFGGPCRSEVQSKLHRRQANWKLDPPLRKACKDSVSLLCAKEDREGGELGNVYRCMIRQYTDLDAGCQKELGRAMHMALFAWAPDGLITSPCDGDAQSLCLAGRPNMASTPGAVARCLGGFQQPTIKDGRPGKQRVSDACSAILDVAEPPDTVSKSQFYDVLLLVSALEDSTGVTMFSRNRRGDVQGVTLTGWTALAGVAALVDSTLAVAADLWLPPLTTDC
ncbi:hypothetical protein FOA52_000675 [Chlamydomonas sp. UWO 241]|nr:hypothetical protein FOA52_000675 [Chlamydomonas sp. UWO 241]